ncbi:MAG: 3-phosphoshikimate 1-carboxyvinyltransferase [Candidatus Omnitrophota bacterium]
MDKIEIRSAKRLKGTIELKGDKSISHRAVMIASIAEGRSRIKNFLKSEDCLATVMAFQKLGVGIDFSRDEVIVEGRGLRGLSGAGGNIYLGNSGTSMRLLSGILAGQGFESTLTGDESLSVRPMDRIIKPLRLMGADICGREDRYAPLVIKGSPLKHIKYKTEVPSAQVKSALILAALYADGPSEIGESLKSRDHTERLLSLFGARMVIEDQDITIYDNPVLKGKSISIPGDISSAAFFIVGSLILGGSEIVIKDLLFNRTRLGIIDVLLDMGADIKVENKRFNGFEETCDLIIKSSDLKGVRVGRSIIPSIIDELPVLLVAALFAQGETYIEGAGELRVKETDRIASMTKALKSMGADISVSGDDISVKGRASLKGTKLDSLGDHRTAMSLAIASIAAEGASEIKGIECVKTSFPDFFDLLDILRR